MTPCPTCGRAASERFSLAPQHRGYCEDPIHDLADHAAELAEALERTIGIIEVFAVARHGVHLPDWPKIDASQDETRAVLAAARKEKP